jgi:hypothetical protein
MNDAIDLAEIARDAGAEDELVNAFAPPRCVLCNGEPAEDQPFNICERCLAPLLNRGWDWAGHAAPDCACGEFAMGWIDGRALCLGCAHDHVTRRGLAGTRERRARDRETHERP